MTERISYAQNGEDVRVWHAFRDLSDGFYVEVGASDPFEDSTTAALSALGWSGLLVEADVALAQRLREARPRDTVVQAAAHSRSGLLTFDAGDARGLGAVVEQGGEGRATTTVPAVRVGDLLADLDPPAVHYLSVDVEGGELEALRGCDLARWQPWVLSVESMQPNSRVPSHEAWEPLVLDAGYTLAAFDGLNRWYVAPGHEDLAPGVAEPLSALDELEGWRRSKERVLEDQVAQLLRHLEAREAEHARELAAREREAETRLSRLREQLGAVEAERDAALERERIMLTSKSWALTKPLRGARLSAWLALQQWRGGTAAAPAPVRAPDGPGDARRRAALVAKVAAARSRAGS